MLEILNEAITPANLPYSVLLGMVVKYWTLVCVGLLDLGHHDTDLPLKEVPKDLEMHPGESGIFAWLQSLLHFLDLGEVPFMVVCSVGSLALWAHSMLFHHYLGHHTLWASALFFVPNVLISLVVTGLCTRPLRMVFPRPQS